MALTREELEVANKILRDIANGSSDSYNDFLYGDYDEVPVDIETFLHNPRYLGAALTDDAGRFTLYPYWENLLAEIFPDPLKPAKYNTLALTGSIGIGKSTEAVVIGLYELYRMLCLKDPYTYYGLMPTDLITFAVINITLEAAKGVAWDKLQQLLQASPWFMAHGTLTKSENPQWKPPKGIELIYGSQSRHIIGRAVFWCFQDEVSFVPTQDIKKQIEKAKTLVNTASARMQSRFMKGNRNPTILVLASSKRTDSSFMETFIEGKKKNDSKTTKVIDEPQWVVRNDKVTGDWFKVAVGNKFLESEIIPLNATEFDIDRYIDKGYTILDVPIGYYENFIDDMDIALTDIAGISTSNASRYIAGSRLSQAKTDSYENPFTKDVIEVGNAPDDYTQYADFFDLSRVPKELKSKPLYIHYDMSISGDKTGIAGTWIIGKKPPQPGLPESKELYFQLAFSVSVKAPKGYQVSFEKNRQFIYWLKNQGFRIKQITSDTFQAYDLGQALLAKGFNWEILSVDRVDGDRVCKPYQYLKSTIYEGRVKIYQKCTLLTQELVSLERDNNSGKVDHPQNGSKDQADAFCGSLFTASKYAQEYAYDYGEDLAIQEEIFDGEMLDYDTAFTNNFTEQLKMARKPKQFQVYEIPDEFYDREGIFII